MSVSIILRPLLPGDFPAFRQLYESAFPLSERKELSFMTDGPHADAYELSVIETPETAVAGLVITVSHGDFVLLDYLAVQPDLRSRGLGHAVLPLLMKRCREKNTRAHVFLEIETPMDCCENPLQRVRRKEFYLSCGFAETFVRAHIYDTDMELLAMPADVPYVTLRAYAELLHATFPADMLSGWNQQQNRT